MKRIVVAEWRYGQASCPVKGRVPTVVDGSVKLFGSHLPCVRIGHWEDNLRLWWLTVGDHDGVSILPTGANKGMRQDARDKILAENVCIAIAVCTKENLTF